MSGVIEYLPVTVSLQTAAGCDLVLFDLIDRLVDRGLVPHQVLSGSVAFTTVEQTLSVPDSPISFSTLL